MTTTPSQVHQTNAGARRRQLRLMQLALAGAAAVGMLALFDAASPDSTRSVLDSASVRLADLAVPAPASGPVAPQLPQTPPVVGGGSFGADDNDGSGDSDQIQQQLNEQEQLDMQQMLQSQQQAEEQNEEAEQQFEQGMQQAQMDEQQANDP